MRLFKKTNIPYIEFGYEVGDIVEMKFKGKWLLGEICVNELGNEVYFTHLNNGGSYYKIHEYQFRRTEDTITKATQYYEDTVQDLRDRINHKHEKERINDFQKKIAELARGVGAQRPTHPIPEKALLQAELKAYRRGYAAGNAARNYRKANIQPFFEMLPVTAPPDTKVLFVATQVLDGEQMYRIANLNDVRGRARSAGNSAHTKSEELKEEIEKVSDV